MKLIDKAIVVAEIERRRDLHFKNYIEKGFESSEGKYDEDKDILSFIDTLKVKEVDFGEVYHKFLQDEWFGKHCSMTISEFMAFTAKHFFELGLKTQKGE